MGFTYETQQGSVIQRVALNKTEGFACMATQGAGY